MRKLGVKTLEPGSSYAVGFSLGQGHKQKAGAQNVTVTAKNKREALKVGKKEWRRRFDPSAFFRVYGEHAKG